MTLKPGPLLLAVASASGTALGALAPWSGAALAFAALALVQAAASGALLAPRLGRGLPGGRRGLLLLCAAALLVRLPLLLAPPTLSDDVHRYVADGRLWIAGHDAWRTPPAAVPAVARAPVNHPHLATIYPPFAEGVFVALAAAGLGERAFRALFALCDVATAALLARVLARRGRAPWPAAAFALHPLAALESAGSGHAEALALVLLVLGFERAAAGRRGASVLALAAAAGVKPFALLALPFFAPAWGRARTLVALGLAAGQWIVLALASARAGEASGLGAYVATWRHNDLVFGGLLASGLAPSEAKGVLVAALALVVAGLAARRAAPWRGYAWAAATALLLSPVLHPWYALALLAALPALDRRGPRATAWLLATLVLATYVLPAAAGDTPGFRVLPLSVRLWELAPVLAVFAFEAGRAAAARGGEGRWTGSRFARDG